MLLRVISFLVAFFAFSLLVLASPLSENGIVVENLEKRITHTGRGTWYYPGLGNCGFTDSASDDVVAIAKTRYDAADGGNCNQWIAITNSANGKTAYALTRDSCPGCGENDLDLSPAVFSQIADLDTGVISISWNFMSKSWSP
ncbi:uncharacterized protein FOMMEDRAFT_171272 [Fomitiporia mediterranea MF3/22]|uniref:uncharacterized protein n=1 Tax=Fomitiporia mediterranea (strain MF3/22) TaxID=694068 RepID=UPI0004409326|nr:uncharacterized protein FOMMEDRAFT_171272 [Fomitiporia mediterranea MF3/22]EJC97860.1 hypothetical protein FOMMEDRAFT_171272 [Fomitiporia mediterranea MF3/22]